MEEINGTATPWQYLSQIKLRDPQEIMAEGFPPGFDWRKALALINAVEELLADETAVKDIANQLLEGEAEG